jgi:hypothetical protein
MPERNVVSSLAMLGAVVLETALDAFADATASRSRQADNELAASSTSANLNAKKGAGCFIVHQENAGRR